MHPFTGGKKSKTVTLKHRPLIWENMLGTVYACDPVTRKAKYFDYDYTAAHAYARVNECSDLRVTRNKRQVNYTDGSDYMSGPRVGKYALWGIKPLIS